MEFQERSDAEMLDHNHANDSAGTRKAPHVMIFVESEQGFGHFNIVDKVAKSLHEKGAEVAIASGNFDHAGEAFSFSAGTKETLPCVQNIDGKAQDPHTGEPYEGDFIRRRMKAVYDACEREQPDTVMFELFPFMMEYRNYDVQAVRQWAKDHGKDLPVISLCRDIVHSNKPQQVLDTIDQHFDEILVRGCGRFARLEDSKAEWAQIKKPLTYTGNIVSPMPEATSAPDAPVVIFGGGGHYPELDDAFFLETIRARKHAGPELSKRPWKIFVSDNCPMESLGHFYDLIKQEAPDGGIELSPPIHNTEFRELMASSAATIMRGGYNTAFELAAIHKPFIMIPRPERAEQRLRAERMSVEGFCSYLPQYTAKAETIGSALQREFQRDHSSVQSVDMRGAEKVADHLLARTQSRQLPSPSIAGEREWQGTPLAQGPASLAMGA